MQSLRTKFKFTYLLVILLIIFGLLYFRDFSYRDLWANLFASLTIILAIDQIVKRAEMQKSQRSINMSENEYAILVQN